MPLRNPVLLVTTKRSLHKLIFVAKMCKKISLLCQQDVSCVYIHTCLLELMSDDSIYTQVCPSSVHVCVHA